MLYYVILQDMGPPFRTELLAYNAVPTNTECVRLAARAISETFAIARLRVALNDTA